MTHRIKHALRELPLDERDFKFSAIHPPVNLNELAGQNFESYHVAVKDQGDTQECTSYASSYALEAHEGTPISSQYIWKEICKSLNDLNPQGTDLRTAAKAAVQGSIELKDLPSTLELSAPTYRYNWANWPSQLDLLASVHKQKSYFFTDKGFDAFRSALWQYRDKKSFIVTGCLWDSEWTAAQGGIIPKTYNGIKSGHSFVFTGQKIINGEPYLVSPNSIGTKYGDNGYFYFPREVVDKEFTFGAIIFIDIDPEDAKYYQEAGAKITDNWILVLLKRLRYVLGL